MRTYKLFIDRIFKCKIAAHLDSDIAVGEALEEAGYEFSSVYMHHQDDDSWDIDRIDTGETVAYLIPEPYPVRPCDGPATDQRPTSDQGATEAAD
ncbi:MAG: hypothetical protein EOP04_09410 [Proteobacteria bacterium]|nr:MAG: hypothetical protein EOP04_09410 [Pseudomonadota bacterium]